MCSICHALDCCDPHGMGRYAVCSHTTHSLKKHAPYVVHFFNCIKCAKQMNFPRMATVIYCHVSTYKQSRDMNTVFKSQFDHIKLNIN